jgi:hypothetical protein
VPGKDLETHASSEICASIAMKVNAKLGGFNFRLTDDYYPRIWRQLKEEGSIQVKNQQGLDITYFPAIILIGKRPVNSCSLP